MTRDYNSSSNSNSRNPRSPRSQENRDNRRSNNNRPHHSRNNHHRKNYSKSGIFLKSTVIALGIVLVVLAAALFVVKKNKNLSLRSIVAGKCENVKTVKINSKIEQVINGRHEVLVLTKSNRGKQEIIKLDKNCLNEVSRNSFSK